MSTKKAAKITEFTKNTHSDADSKCVKIKGGFEVHKNTRKRQRIVLTTMLTFGGRWLSMGVVLAKLRELHPRFHWNTNHVRHALNMLVKTECVSQYTWTKENKKEARWRCAFGALARFDGTEVYTCPGEGPETLLQF